MHCMVPKGCNAEMAFSVPWERVHELEKRQNRSKNLNVAEPSYSHRLNWSCFHRTDLHSRRCCPAHGVLWQISQSQSPLPSVTAHTNLQFAPNGSRSIGSPYESQSYWSPSSQQRARDDPGRDQRKGSKRNALEAPRQQGPG